MDDDSAKILLENGQVIDIRAYGMSDVEAEVRDIIRQIKDDKFTVTITRPVTTDMGQLKQQRGRWWQR